MPPDITPTIRRSRASRDDKDDAPFTHRGSRTKTRTGAASRTRARSRRPAAPDFKAPAQQPTRRARPASHGASVDAGSSYGYAASRAARQSKLCNAYVVSSSSGSEGETASAALAVASKSSRATGTDKGRITAKKSRLGDAYAVSSSSGSEGEEAAAALVRASKSSRAIGASKGKLTARKSSPMVFGSVEIAAPKSTKPASTSTSTSTRKGRKSDVGAGKMTPKSPIKPERKSLRLSTTRYDSSSDSDFGAFRYTGGDADDILHHRVPAISAFMKQTAAKREPTTSYINISDTLSTPQHNQESPLPRVLLTDMSSNTSSIMNLLLPTKSFPTPEIMQKKISVRAFPMRVNHSQATLDLQKKHFGSSERYIPVDFLRSMFPHASARSIAELVIKAKMVNLAQLALDIIPHLLNEDAVTEDKLLELDMRFPGAFVDDMDLALYTGWGRERIIKAAFEFGKMIRVFWLVKALNSAKRKGDTTEESTYNMVRETFYAEGDEEELDPEAAPTKFRGWEIAGLAEGSSRPGDPVLPEEYIPDVKEMIKSVRKAFKKGKLDDEKARTLFPWDKFVVEAVNWVKTIHEFLKDVEWKVNRDFDKAQEEARAEKEKKEKEAEKEREEKERQAEERFRASWSQRQRMLNDPALSHRPAPPEFPGLSYTHGISPQAQRSATKSRTQAVQGQGPPIKPFSSFADHAHHDDDHYMTPAPLGPSVDDLHISSPLENGGIMLPHNYDEHTGPAPPPGTATAPSFSPAPSFTQSQMPPPHTAPQVTPQTLPYGSTPYAPLQIADGPGQHKHQQQPTHTTAKPKGRGRPAKPGARKRRKCETREEFRVPRSGVPLPPRVLRHSTANAEDDEVQEVPGTHIPQPPVDTSQRQEDDVDDDGDEELKDAYASFGLPLQATPRDKPGDGNGEITSTMGWSIGKRKRVFPGAENADGQAHNDAQQPSVAETSPQQSVEATTAAAAAAAAVAHAANNAIPEGYVPYPQSHPQGQQQQQQPAVPEPKPKPKRQRKSRAKTQPAQGVDGNADPNAPAPVKSKGGRPNGSKNKEPGAPKVPRAPRKKKGQDQQEQKQQQEPPSAPVSAVDAYTTLPAPPATVAPSSVTNMPALSDPSWVAYSEPVPHTQQLTYSTVTNSNVPAPAPTTTVGQSPALTNQSYQTATEQVQAQQAQQAQQELQHHQQQQQQIEQQRLEQDAKSRSSVPLPNQSLSHGPVPLPTQSQGSYQRVPLPTQSMTPVQIQSQKQPPSNPLVEPQQQPSRPTQSSWQTQPSSSNYPNNILSTPPISTATTTTAHLAKTDATPPLLHISDHDHSDFNASFELRRILSPPTTFTQPAPSALTAMRSAATRPQPQTHTYNDDVYQRSSSGTPASGSAPQSAGTSSYAAPTATSQVTSNLPYTGQQRTIVPPRPTSITQQTPPVQQTISQNTDTSFRASTASSTAAGGGRVTPVGAARASAYAAARNTNTSPLSASVQQQSYVKQTTAPNYATQNNSQPHQYGTQQSASQQRQQQQVQQTHQASNSVHSYMPYDDFSYRLPSAGSTSTRDTYPVTTAPTQNLFASPTAGSTSYQTSSHNYLPTTTVSQTSSYAAAANPSVHNITNAALPHASSLTQQAYQPAAASSTLNISASSTLHNTSSSQQPYGYSASSTPVVRTSAAANQEPSPRTSSAQAYPRQVWITEEINALKDRVILHGPKWALIKREDERSISPKLAMRSQQQIKDKAQQIAVMYYQ
ncbi:hypothetical protein KEM56_002136 [Ascosphaera pollenicola]|nr:hypothetical protein KEM56_002136 [Ascosphaera pollenicola]